MDRTPEWETHPDPKGMLSSILSSGWRIGKRIAITGAAITSAPVLLPPLAVLSALGFAFSVPFGLVFAGFICNDKVMRYLLSVPGLSEEELELLYEEGFEEEAAGIDEGFEEAGEEDYEKGVVEEDFSRSTDGVEEENVAPEECRIETEIEEEEDAEEENSVEIERDSGENDLDGASLVPIDETETENAAFLGHKNEEMRDEDEGEEVLQRGKNEREIGQEDLSWAPSKAIDENKEENAGLKHDKIEEMGDERNGHAKIGEENEGEEREKKEVSQMEDTEEGTNVNHIGMVFSSEEIVGSHRNMVEEVSNMGKIGEEDKKGEVLDDATKGGNATNEDADFTKEEISSEEPVTDTRREAIEENKDENAGSKQYKIEETGDEGKRDVKIGEEDKRWEVIEDATKGGNASNEDYAFPKEEVGSEEPAKTMAIAIDENAGLKQDKIEETGDEEKTDIKIGEEEKTGKVTGYGTKGGNNSNENDAFPKEEIDSEELAMHSRKEAIEENKDENAGVKQSKFEETGDEGKRGVKIGEVDKSRKVTEDATRGGNFANESDAFREEEIGSGEPPMDSMREAIDQKKDENAGLKQYKLEETNDEGKRDVKIGEKDKRGEVTEDVIEGGNASNENFAFRREEISNEEPLINSRKEAIDEDKYENAGLKQYKIEETEDEGKRDVKIGEEDKGGKVTEDATRGGNASDENDAFPKEEIGSEETAMHSRRDAIEENKDINAGLKQYKIEEKGREGKRDGKIGEAIGGLEREEKDALEVEDTKEGITVSDIGEASSARLDSVKEENVGSHQCKVDEEEEGKIGEEDEKEATKGAYAMDEQESFPQKEIASEELARDMKKAPSERFDESKDENLGLKQYKNGEANGNLEKEEKEYLEREEGEALKVKDTELGSHLNDMGGVSSMEIDGICISHQYNVGEETDGGLEREEREALKVEDTVKVSNEKDMDGVSSVRLDAGNEENARSHQYKVEEIGEVLERKESHALKVEDTEKGLKDGVSSVGIDVVNEQNAGSHQNKVEEETGGGLERENIITLTVEHPDLSSEPTGATSGAEAIEPSEDEGFYSEEKLWQQINALRMIVGYKEDLHTSFMEELTALYVFTGVDPPALLSDSALVEANDRLRFLKSVVGVK